MLLLACAPGDPEVKSGPDDPALTDTDTATDSATESGADTGEVPASTGLAATMDDDVRSLLWATWTQNQPATVRVEYRFEGEAWLSTPARAVEPGEVRQLVAGAPYGAAVELRVVSTGADEQVSEAITAHNGGLPRDCPEVEELSGDATAWDPGTAYVFLSLADGRFGSWNLIVDRQGRVVWAWESGNGRVALHSRVSLDGRDLLVDENSYWAIYDDGKAATILRMKLDGTLVETLDVPGCHHPFTDLPDGSIVYTAMDGRGETVRRRWPDGTVEDVWDCETLLAEVGDRGYCASNTLWYDAARDHVLNSIYSIETIVDVDLATGTHQRWFGHTSDAWAFDPPESAFWWQHGGYVTAAGTLLTSSMGTGRSEETVVREYAFDEATETLVEVWSFGEGEGIFGDVMGEAHRLGNGNTLHNFGSATRLREITPDGRVVWDVDWNASTMGRSTPVADLYAFVE